MKTNILIVEDERIIVDIVRRGLQQHGFQVWSASCAQEAWDVFKSEQVDLAILDYSLPDICGAELFRQVRAVKPDLPVVFLTGHANLQTAVELMRNGVCDYLTKPFNLEELALRIKAILETARLTGGKPARGPKSATRGWFPGGYIFGDSEAMRGVDTQIRNLQRYPDTTVLITGPTGTGKSVVARRIHELSRDQNAPFVEIDCSTIPRELCESELFGHEKGAFTGAHRTKLGLFEAAAAGTAFLDEIGELDLALQAKLLHVLEAHEFKRVGGETTLSMSARVIAATNRSLPDLVRAGRFREDLYFRLNVFELWMPPLRERGEDVQTLARHFLEYFATRYHKVITGFTEDALSFLRNCDFPGNVRELRNLIERAVINSDVSLIHFAHLVSLRRPATPPVESAAPPPPVCPAPTATSLPQAISSTKETLNLADFERQKLREAMVAAHGNKSKAAAIVGLSRTAFYRRLRKHEGGTGNSLTS